MTGGYDCAYCPLGGIGEPVMLDGYPAHPDCADACDGLDLAQVRADSKPWPGYTPEAQAYEIATRPRP
jgi:hypothetical protein